MGGARAAWAQGLANGRAPRGGGGAAPGGPGGGEWLLKLGRTRAEHGWSSGRGLAKLFGPKGRGRARQGGVSPRAACSGAEPHREDQGRGRRSEVEPGAVSAVVRPRGGAGPDPGLGLCKLRGAKVGAGWGGSVGGASHSRARVPMSWQLGMGPPVTWPRLDGAGVGLGAWERCAGDHRSQPCAWACTHSSCTA